VIRPLRDDDIPQLARVWRNLRPWLRFLERRGYVHVRTAVISAVDPRSTAFVERRGYLRGLRAGTAAEPAQAEPAQ
jgi:hypothetical protein